MRSSTGSAIDAIAIVQGAGKASGFNCPRQTNEFYHLCGIETPHAYLILDGRDRKVTLLLPPRDARLESAEGKVLSADDAELVKRLTGVAAVASTQGMTEEWLKQLLRGTETADLHARSPGGRQHRVPGRAAGARTRRSRPTPGTAGRRARPPRANCSATRFPKNEVRDLTPILDEIRAVKSPREIALIRRASQLAGRGLIEAMKSTRPGRL